MSYIISFADLKIYINIPIVYYYIIVISIISVYRYTFIQLTLATGGKITSSVVLRE